MAQLNFSGLQPVGFGGRECMPKLDAELRLRIQMMKTETEADKERGAEILAEAFPKDSEYVRKFILEQMTSYEMRELQVYLSQGAEAAKNISDAVKEALKDEIRKATA